MDWVDSAFGSPVDLGCSNWLERGNGLVLVECQWTSISEELLVLSISPGGEFVVINLEGIVWVSVDFEVLSILGLEDVQSELKLLLGSI